MSHDFYVSPFGKKSIAEIADNANGEADRTDVNDDEKIMAFIGFPSAKDPDFSNRYPGKSVACVITEGKFDWVKEWNESKTRHRPEGYVNIKKRMQTLLLEALFRYFPNLREIVEFVEIGSPLSNSFYYNVPSGESYGLEQSPSRFTKDEIADLLRPETPIPNLYITGQDVSTNGVAGAMIGGVLTAFKVLGPFGTIKCLARRG